LTKKEGQGHAHLTKSLRKDRVGAALEGGKKKKIKEKKKTNWVGHP